MNIRCPLCLGDKEIVEPTQEQIKELTEEQRFEMADWCGFKLTSAKYCDNCRKWEGQYWIKGGIGKRIYRLELLKMMNSDNLLGFLFEYAVPKVIDYYIEKHGKGFPRETARAIGEDFFYRKVGMPWLVEALQEDQDPALALFYVLDKVRQEGLR